VHLALVADKLGQKDIARRNLDLGLKRLGEVTARGFLWRNLNGKAQNLNMTLK